MKKIGAIILAAGLSSRMGRSKLLLAWGNTTVLVQTIQNVQAVVRDVIVVTGAYAAETRRIAETSGTTPIHNSDYAKGEMISSLQAGLRAMGDVDGFLVMLGDMPLVEPETMREILAFWEATGGIVAPAFEGKRGHPVVFSAEFTPHLLALSWQETPRTVIQANRHHFHTVPVATSSVLIDLDTPERYKYWHRDKFGTSMEVE